MFCSFAPNLMFMLILSLPFKSHIDSGLRLFSEFGFWWGAGLNPSSRHSLPYGSVCRYVLGNGAQPWLLIEPAEHVWKSRDLAEQDIYFLGQKEQNLALGSGGKSWRPGFLPALCDTENAFLNDWIQGFNVGHMGFYGLGPALQCRETGGWV